MYESIVDVEDVIDVGRKEGGRVCKGEKAAIPRKVRDLPNIDHLAFSRVGTFLPPSQLRPGTILSAHFNPQGLTITFEVTLGYVYRKSP